MLPVCQCSSWRPVMSTSGYSASGRSAAGVTTDGTKRARPSGVGNRSVNTTRCPGSSSSAHGYVTAPSRCSRSHVMPAIDGISERISS